MKKLFFFVCLTLAVCVANAAFNPIGGKAAKRFTGSHQPLVTLQQAGLSATDAPVSPLTDKLSAKRQSATLNAAQPSRVSSLDELIGTRIWNFLCVGIEDSVDATSGDTTYYLVEQSPYYCGHSIDIEAGEGDSIEIYFYVYGNTEYSVAGKVDLDAGTISIPNMQRVDYESTTDTTTSGSGDRQITTITTSYYDMYLYNADDGTSDITLTIMEDGSLYFENWFAVVGYIKQDVTQTSRGRSNTTEGEWQGLYVFDGYSYGSSAYILVPNGVHKMTSYYSGDYEAPIYMQLNNTQDSVFIVNLFDWGMRGNYMTYEQTEGGAMTFPCQMIYDYGDTTKYGDHIYNYTADAELTNIEGYGNEGLAYQDSLVWNYCLAFSDSAYAFDFTTYNKIYFVDGTRFFEESAEHGFKLGDVNHDGNVDINDVTLLIDYVLGNTVEFCCPICAEITGDGSVDINDVTALIDKVLGNS